MFRGATSLDESKKKPLDNALSFFSLFLSEHDYAAGEHMTIADLSLLASASSMEVRKSTKLQINFILNITFNYKQGVAPNIFKDHPKIKEWIDRCKNQITDYHELNQVGVDIFGQMGQAALAKIVENKAA